MYQIFCQIHFLWKKITVFEKIILNCFFGNLEILLLVRKPWKTMSFLRLARFRFQKNTILGIFGSSKWNSDLKSVFSVKNYVRFSFQKFENRFRTPLLKFSLLTPNALVRVYDFKNTKLGFRVYDAKIHVKFRVYDFWITFSIHILGFATYKTHFWIFRF